MNTHLCDTEALQWLTLLQCPKLGIATLTKLRALLPSLLHLYNDSSASFLSAPQRQFLKNYETTAARQLSYIKHHHIQVIPIESALYPTQLKNTSRPPIVLFCKGNVGLLQQPQIAFVGSRTPTAYGHQVTKHLVQDLIHQTHGSNYVITSGLALGIDAIAHQSAVEANHSSTIAVMGSGHQYIYPKRHERLAAQIIESEGVLLTEFLPDEKPQQFNFPRRNRIIAGLSRGTVVVEAAVKSGSLITASYALEEGRDVFAVPGNLFNKVSAGCHELIKQGAKIVTSAADIIEEYEFVIKNPPLNVKKGLAGSDLLASVDHDTTPIDVISQRANLPMDKVLVELLDLEIQGLISAVPGGYCRVATHSNNK